MAKYYSLEEAAQVLGIAPAELNRMRERNEARAYRDGANWKFKVEDIEGLLAKRKSNAPDESPADSGDDVLLTDLDFETSDEGSGTIIGPTEGAAAPLSDIQLSGASDLRLGDPGSTGPLRGKSAASTGSSDLDLTLDEDFTFEDSQIQLQNRPGGKLAGDSNVNVAGEGLDDDDLVLGGSGSGSDITIGGDSGISLVDPTDSGLSLEEPLEFETADSDSLELGEDDMLTFSEEADTESPTELKADDDFLLTPLEEVGDEESESGSQVIALDAEAETEGVPGTGSAMAAMLDEDTTAAPAFGFDTAAIGAGGPAVTPGRPAFAEAPAGAATALPEAPYSTGVVVAMAFCALFLAFAGMMAFDLLRSMWSWQEPYSFNSALMDMILGLFG